MSEKEPLRLRFMRVDADDFIRFMQAKNPNSACNVCGSEEWTVICPADGGDAYRLGMLVRNKKKQFYYGTFAYHCDNCGYVRNHAARIVHKWVAEHPADDDSVNEPDDSALAAMLDDIHDDD